MSLLELWSLSAYFYIYQYIFAHATLYATRYIVVHAVY